MIGVTEQCADLLTLADMPDLPDHDGLRRLFDRLGLLDPGGQSSPPLIMLRFAGTEINCSPDIDAAAGVTLRIGLAQPKHGRSRHLQQVQHLCAAAAMIGSALGAARLYWAPAQLWSPVAALVEAVAASEAQGLPPILHLVAFLPDDDAGVTTRGLSHFGQSEMRLRAEPPLPIADAVRRLARLAVHALLVGPMAAGARVPGLLPGEVISIGKPVQQDGQPVTPIMVRFAQ